MLAPLHVVCIQSRIISLLLLVVLGLPQLTASSETALSFTIQTSPTKSTLLSIQFPTPQQGWAVGSGGTILTISFTASTLTISPAPPTILSVTVADPTHVVIHWSAISNVVYRVQALSDFNTGWVDLEPDVRAGDITAAAVDNPKGDEAQRFYRILVVP